jgi:DNA-directed RNA polymerase III subunit RPC5
MATGGDKPPSLDDDIDIVMTDAAPATSSAAACTTRFAPRAKGKPVLKPKPKPKPEPKAEPEPKSEPVTEAIPAPPKEDGDDAMDVDVAGKGAGPDEEEEEDFVVREIDVYFTPKPFDDDGKVTPPLPPPLCSLFCFARLFVLASSESILLIWGEYIQAF